MFSIRETYVSALRNVRFPQGKHKKCQDTCGFVSWHFSFLALE